LSQGEFLHLKLETGSSGGRVHIGYNSHVVTGLLVKCREQCLVEARNESVGVNDIVCLATVQGSIPALALRYETWQCLVRVTAWILKWSRLRGKPKKGKVSEEELKESEFKWLRNRQTVVFLPEIEELCNKGQLNQKSH